MYCAFRYLIYNYSYIYTILSPSLSVISPGWSGRFRGSWKFNSEGGAVLQNARGLLMRIEGKFPGAFQRSREYLAHIILGDEAMCRGSGDDGIYLRNPTRPFSLSLFLPFLRSCSAIFIYEDLSDDVKLLAMRSAGINRTWRALRVRAVCCLADQDYSLC